MKHRTLCCVYTGDLINS